MVIWKYELTTSKQTVDMPGGARVLDIQLQDHETVLWALVNPGLPVRPYTVLAINTGQRVESILGYRYVSTVQYSHGVVKHFFVQEG